MRLVISTIARYANVAHAANLEELGRLVKTLGYEVVGTISQKRDELDGATLLGKGRLEELAAITGGTGAVGSMAIQRKSKARERFQNADERKPDARQMEPDPEAPPRPAFVIVDHDISPSQARNLERATGAQVLDRTGVIVEIFHRHAHSREAKLQVEMARLKYIAPRLRESSAGGERQQGYGAGESDLELDRRKIRDRLAELKQQLDDIQRDSDQRRSARRDQLWVALVGYTNAGKWLWRRSRRPRHRRRTDRRGDYWRNAAALWLLWLPVRLLRFGLRRSRSLRWWRRSQLLYATLQVLRPVFRDLCRLRWLATSMPVAMCNLSFGPSDMVGGIGIPGSARQCPS